MNIKNIINESVETAKQLLSPACVKTLEKIAEILIGALKTGNKILAAGNGGSAADAQHFCGELIGQMSKLRQALPAISLSTDPSVLTALGNDLGYDQVFSRQVQALGKPGDVFLAISTSGNSKNLVAAAKVASARGLKVIGLLGKGGGILAQDCQVNLIVPSSQTQRIQESHALIIHILAEAIDHAFSN